MCGFRIREFHGPISPEHTEKHTPQGKNKHMKLFDSLVMELKRTGPILSCYTKVLFPWRSSIDVSAHTVHRTGDLSMSQCMQ